MEVSSSEITSITTRGRYLVVWLDLFHLNRTFFSPSRFCTWWRNYCASDVGRDLYTFVHCSQVSYRTCICLWFWSTMSLDKSICTQDFFICMTANRSVLTFAWFRACTCTFLDTLLTCGQLTIQSGGSWTRANYAWRINFGGPNRP